MGREEIDSKQRDFLGLAYICGALRKIMIIYH